MQQWFATEMRSRITPAKFQRFYMNDIYSTLEVPMAKDPKITIHRRKDPGSNSWIYEATLQVTQHVSSHVLDGKDAGRVETMYVEKMLREAAGVTARAKVEDVVIEEGTGFSREQRKVGTDLTCSCCGQSKRGRRF